MRRLAIIAAACAFLTGCSVGQDSAAAGTAIQDFHSKLNAGEFAEIYDQSGASMKAAATEDKLTALLDAVHRKLGAYVSGSQTSWNENFGTTGHTIRIQYASKFERGEATETFVFQLDGKGTPALVGYNVNSMALITN